MYQTMQILNLASAARSNIPWYKIFFPDGEVQIRLGEFSRKDSVQVDCRVTNSEDLFVLMQVIDILNRHEVDYTVNIRYLMSQRMDRVMDFNSPLSLKIVLECLSGARAIDVFCPHNAEALRRFSNEIAQPTKIGLWDAFIDEISEGKQIILPDAGAVKRYADIDNCIICDKVRDIATGKITSIKVTNPDNFTDKPLLIVDDLCDGGGTFIGIAKAIKEIKPNADISICVAHMVNQKGIINLSENFTHVWFTNSYKNWDNLPENVTMVRII